MLDSHTGVRRGKKAEKNEKRNDDDENGEWNARPFFIIPFITFSIKRFGVCLKIFPPLPSSLLSGVKQVREPDGLERWKNES